MNKLWYVSIVWSSSTARGTLRWVLLGAIGVASCASTPPGGGGGGALQEAAAASAVVASRTTADLAGARCKDGACKCRVKGSGDVESSPPEEGKKRFEIRLSVEGGRASLESPVLGTLASAGEDVCAYVDVIAGTTHEMTFTARAKNVGAGMAPTLEIAEYGPTGPYWYDVLDVHCAGASGRCDRFAADEWARTARQRKRGRIDPCGSSVVTKLNWETTGGQGDRDGGHFRDFTVSFTWEVKKFATQFKPGSTECVPK